MKILNKIIAKQKDLNNSEPITIAFLGDSVTQGCFECYYDENGQIQTIFDAKSAYSTRLKEMLSLLYPSVQINIINAGISGDYATTGNKRFERDIARFNPDLVVVAFGLNDSCNGLEKIGNYTGALQEIFNKINNIGAESIFIANNMMNTKVSCHLIDERMINTGKFFIDYQNTGIVKQYMQEGKKIAEKNGAAVVDLYNVWEKMYQGGVDTTELLANKFNHPIRELHYYTAIKLLEKILDI